MMNAPEENNKNDETVMILSVADQADETIMMPAINNDETVILQTEKETQSSKATEKLAVGSTLQHRFLLKEILGSGGMGTVYRATDLRRQEAKDHQPDVAIKVLNDEFRDDPELFIALQRETKKSQLLAHPNIVTVYDFDRDGKNVFMVMELLEGQSLSKFIKQECAEGIAFKNAWYSMKGLFLALAYAHKKNIIHYDFKPGNVVITAEGSVKVLDFGIACAVVNSEMYQADTVFNARDLGALTPAYASLEMLQGKPPSPADDVYALACVCYEILAGKHPYGRLSAEKALELNLEPPVIQGLSRRQRLALNHALALKGEQRTATIDDFLAEIEPKSIWPKVLGGGAIITLLAVTGSYYYIFNELDFVDDKIISLSQEQQLAVKDFLELAQIHFEVGYLTAPSGSNALWAYRQVLGIDPYNQQAQKGLKKIAAIIKQQASGLFEAGNHVASLAKIEEGLEAVPKDEELLELKSHILNSGLIELN
jgi:serine/threonine protein kinase